MIDRDGVVRPDDTFAHEAMIKHDSSIKIDDSYDYHTKNPFKIVYRGVLIFLVTIFLNIYYYIVLRLHGIDRKNLKGLKKKKVIVAINHTHPLDVPIVVFNLFPFSRCYFVTIRENLQIPGVRHFVKLGGAIPKPVDLSSTIRFNREVTELVEHKKRLVFAREGSLWSYYRGYRPPKRGVYAYASKTNAVVVPIVFTYKKKKRIFSKKKKFYPICTICKPVYPNENLNKRDSEVDLELRSETQIKEVIKKAYDNLEKE